MRAIAKASVLLGLVLSCAATAAEDGVVYVPEGSANQILVLDQASGDMLRRIEGVPEVHGLSVTPDGRFLVAGSFAESAVEGGAPPPKPDGVSADEHATHHAMSAREPQQEPAMVSYVSIVRADDGSIVRQIAVPGAVHHTAVSPDGRYAVATHPSGDAISLIVLGTFEVTTVATGPLPNYAVISGDGTRVYVSNAGNDTVSEVDARRGIVLRNFVVGASPEHLVLAPDGERLYVANVQDGTVSVVALPEGQVVQTFEIGGLLHGLDLANDGATLFVSAREADQVVGIDLRSEAMARRSLSPQPYHLTADGDQIYVTSAKAPTLWVLDAGSLELVREIPLQDIGHQVVVAPAPAA